MKNLTLTLVFLVAACFICTATVLTVSNDPKGGAQFGSLQAAYNAATNGDTLLLEGTGITYNLSTSGQRWSKSLTVIGIGFNPQKQNPRRTYIGVTASESWFIISNGGNGSKFYGIEFTGGVLCENNPSNYLFETCKFYALFHFNGWTVSNFTFRNCVWDQDNSINVQLANGNGTIISNILFNNCIFDGYIEGNNDLFITMLVDHCLFLGTNGSFSQLHFANIMNSMFMNSFPSGVTNSNFANNLCRVAGTFPPTGGGGNSGANNLNATNPNFVNFNLGSFYSTSWDFHLQAGSPAISAASDGTEIGLHGGTTKFSETGEPLIAPVMRFLNISNPSISPNGTLNIDISASKPTDN